MSVDAEAARPAAAGRARLPFVLAGAVAAGVLAAVMGPAVFLGAVLAAAVAGALLYPREAALPVALVAPLANLGVLRVPNVIDIRFHQILWLTVLFSILARAVLGRPLVLGRPPRWLAWSLVGLAGWQLLSALANGGGVRSVVEVAQIGFYSVVLWLLAACYAGLPADRRRRMLRVAGIGGGVVLASWLAYHLSGANWPISVKMTLGGSIDFAPLSKKIQEAGETGVVLKRMGMFGVPAVSAASILAAVPGLTLAVGLTARSARDRLAGWLLFIVASTGLLLTFSRAGWVVGVLVVLLVSWRVGRGSMLWVGLALAVGAVVLLGVPQVAARVQDFSNPEESSTQYHIRLYEKALGFANAQPVFGGGPDSFVERTANPVTGEETPVHNFVLEAASETGWVGAVLAVGLVVALLRWGWRRLGHAPPLEFAFWCGVLASVLMAMTMNGFREDTLWVWAGFMVGAGITAERASAAGPAS